MKRVYNGTGFWEKRREFKNAKEVVAEFEGRMNVEVRYSRRKRF